MMLREAIGVAASRLSGISETPRLDAELLAAHALGVERERLILAHLGDPEPAALAALVGRRERGEPIAYIIGHRDFWTLRLHVGPGVLIPRPDSETLIETAVAHFRDNGPGTILDLGTGSGALLLAALDQWPRSTGTGIDISERAVEVARGNATRLGMSERAQIILGSWDEAVSGRFDLILCNPPYIAVEERLPISVSHFEPSTALFAGPDGLADYRYLAPRIGRLLSARGLALFEIGATQGRDVAELFHAQGYLPHVMKDLAGRDRCIAFTAI